MAKNLPGAGHFFCIRFKGSNSKFPAFLRKKSPALGTFSAIRDGFGPGFCGLGLSEGSRGAGSGHWGPEKCRLGPLGARKVRAGAD